jgi:RNA polymerase sporulation-specific sigma factor
MKTDLSTIVSENQNLVYSIASSFTNYQDKEDLFQVGAMGLMKACKNYDPSLNVKLTTYAHPFILGEMRKYIREDKGIKVSRDLSRLNSHIDRAISLLSQKFMREPTIVEVSEWLNIPESMVADAMNANNSIQSIDEPINDDGKELNLYDVISVPERTSIDSLIELKKALLELTSEEKKIIQARYFNDLTQVETAKLLNTSQVNISRQEQRILGKLKGKLVN